MILSADSMMGVARLQALSPDGRCKVFDAGANGFVRGEGCGLVVLKRLSDAQREGDRIWGLIRGSAVNQDGRSTGLTTPNVLAQESLLREALRDSRVDPGAVGYVETHGTGTSLGDPIEVEALRAVTGRARSDGTQCVLGALKANVGHLEAAAGVSGLIKAVLSLEHGKIRETSNFRTLNPRIRLEGTALTLATAPGTWPRSGVPRFAGVSSFGISGTNAHVVLEEAPVPHDTPRAPERSAEIFVVSARSAEALWAQSARLSAHLSAHAELGLGDVAFSLATTRSEMEHRLSVVASSREELQAVLSAVSQGQTPAGVTRGTGGSSRGKVAFLFTGQGAQVLGMGRGLHSVFPAFREAFDSCVRLFDRELERPLCEVMWAEPGSAEAALLDQTAYTHPALFALEYALWTLWRSWGVEAELLAGHSLGELVAACVAGVFSVEDAVRLVSARGRLMQALPSGGAMVSIAAGEAEVAAAVARYAQEVSIAAVNGPEQVVISGASEAVDSIAAWFAGRGNADEGIGGVARVPLASDGGDAGGVRACGGVCCVPSAVVGAGQQRERQALHGGGVATAGYWVRQARESGSVRGVRCKRCTRLVPGPFIEVGPRSELAGSGAWQHSGRGAGLGRVVASGAGRGCECARGGWVCVVEAAWRWTGRECSRRAGGVYRCRRTHGSGSATGSRRWPKRSASYPQTRWESGCIEWTFPRCPAAVARRYWSSGGGWCLPTAVEWARLVLAAAAARGHRCDVVHAPADQSTVDAQVSEAMSCCNDIQGVLYL